jgi:hypothetical protein
MQEAAILEQRLFKVSLFRNFPIVHLLDFMAATPPSSGAEILEWAASGKLPLALIVGGTASWVDASLDFCSKRLSFRKSL